MKWPKPLNIIYDGQCGFCIRSLNLVGALDLFGVQHLDDARDRAAVEKRFPQLRGADLDEAMYLVAQGEPLYRGFFAFRRLTWSTPLTWALIPLFYFPGSSLLGLYLYGWSARNRSRFGCRSKVCALPAQPDGK